MKTQPKGFALTSLVIIVLVATLIAGVGWYVWQGKDKNSGQPTASNPSSAAKTSTAPAAAEADPTANWVSYTSKAGKFTLKYPKNWDKAANQQNCMPGLVMFGGDSESVGICGSEYFGQMFFMSIKGNNVADQALTTELGYENIKETNVTVDGVEGTRFSGTFGQEPMGPGEPAKGTKVVTYAFYTDGRTYVATYTKTPAFPNVLSDFELMVTKTVKFST